jgi:hypothetical protein
MNREDEDKVAEAILESGKNISTALRAIAGSLDWVFIAILFLAITQCGTK